jgi:MoaA/NifB/PqqE/SkfB family radical SAM enzyme
MNWNKMLMLMQMSFDINVIKGMVRGYNILKEDKNFTLAKYIRMIDFMQQGEKIVKHDGKYVFNTFMPPFPSESFFTNIMAIEEPVNIFSRQIYAKRTAPISFYLSVTHKCPNNCIYCSAGNRKNAEDLTTEEWIKVIHDLQEMNTSIIGITGGEPMIRDDIYDIVKSIDSRSTSILFTSGFNLTPEKAKKLKQNGLFAIGISLDSHDKNTHNQHRRDENAFDYALQAMRYANEAGLYTMSQTVILKEHIDEGTLFKLFKTAKENGAHEVKILEPILSGRLLTEENLDKILYTPEERKKLVEIQHKANHISNFPKITTFAYTECEDKFGCGAGTQHSYISACGDLYPCDFVPMNFGNVKEKGIRELWKEMNEEIGLPKTACFAQQINKKLFIKAEGEIPLNREDSIDICRNNKSGKFPRYYRVLQK